MGNLTSTWSVELCALRCSALRCAARSSHGKIPKIRSWCFGPTACARLSRAASNQEEGANGIMGRLVVFCHTPTTRAVRDETPSVTVLNADVNGFQPVVGTGETHERSTKSMFSTSSCPSEPTDPTANPFSIADVVRSWCSRGLGANSCGRASRFEAS